MFHAFAGIAKPDRRRREARPTLAGRSSGACAEPTDRLWAGAGIGDRRHPEVLAQLVVIRLLRRCQLVDPVQDFVDSGDREFPGISFYYATPSGRILGKNGKFVVFSAI